METPLWDSISEPAKDLIQRMLTTDVNHRITIQEVLNHKWLRVSKAARPAAPLSSAYGGRHAQGKRGRELAGRGGG